jgi:hypothetical protein
MPVHVSGVTRPSSGDSAKMLFGVITCVVCVDYVHVVNTPNSICVEPPENGRVTPETYKGTGS